MPVTTTSRGPVKALVVITYLAMVITNYLANALPLNGRRTGDISDAYPSLFTPAGITFSIWGVIYLLLGAHVLYQLGLLWDGHAHSRRHRRYLLLLLLAMTILILIVVGVHVHLQLNLIQRGHHPVRVACVADLDDHRPFLTLQLRTMDDFQLEFFSDGAIEGVQRRDSHSERRLLREVGGDARFEIGESKVHRVIIAHILPHLLMLISYQ